MCNYIIFLSEEVRAREGVCLRNLGRDENGPFLSRDARRSRGPKAGGRRAAIGFEIIDI